MESIRHFFIILCAAILSPIVLVIFSSVFIPVALTSQTKQYIPVETRTDTVSQPRSKEQPTIDFDDRIKDSWSEGIDRLNVSTGNYLRFNYFDTDKITQKMGDEEATSFNDTVLNSLVSVRKKGDLVPVVLMNKTFSKAILVFQKDKGNGGFIGIFMSANSSSGTKKWQLDSIENL